jgi:DNA helicase-2/ATP-dependent DNA helicase PcrA
MKKYPTPKRKVKPEVEQRADPPKKRWPKAKRKPVTQPTLYDALSSPEESSSLPTVVGSFAEALRKEKAASVSEPHIKGMARAGTGKTTTAVEGMKEVKGIKPSVIPSDQQAAFWDAMKKEKAESIKFTAYNATIAGELKRRLAQTGLNRKGCEASTTHSMGFSAVLRAFPQLKDKEPNRGRTYDILAMDYGFSLHQMASMKPGLYPAINELVSLCKQTLTDPSPENLAGLESHYDIEIPANYRDEVFEKTADVIEKSKDPDEGEMIDFDDMIWLPLVHDLSVYKSDLLIVDEAQDLNKSRQEICKRAGHRVMFIGDDRQAIYGFTGADDKSMDTLNEHLSATKRGCVTLPLTVTRRCGKAIVEEARKIVTDFSAHESNPDGLVGYANYPTYKDSRGAIQERRWEDTYGPMIRPGDMVLCRLNAPMITQCFKLIRNGIRARVNGRQIGKGLVSLIKRMEANSVPDLIKALGQWMEIELEIEAAKKKPSQQKIINIMDKHACLIAMCEDCRTADEVIHKVEAIFTDETENVSVLLSSVHRAKGLEAERVFILNGWDCGMPHPLAKSDWQVRQEMNLMYVAMTRAIRELYWVQ